jgi:hypothetical protein
MPFSQPFSVRFDRLMPTHYSLHYGSQDLIVNTTGVNIYRGCSDDHQLYFGLTPRPPREKWGGITPFIQVPNLQRTQEAAKAVALEGLMKVYKS